MMWRSATMRFAIAISPWEIRSACSFPTRLMDDKFSVAFEFYINVGHALVEAAGVSDDFSSLAWKQVEAGTRGETSMDAWEARKLAECGRP